MDISNKVSPLVLRYDIHSSKASTAASKGVCGEARKGTKWDGIEAERDMMTDVGRGPARSNQSYVYVRSKSRISTSRLRSAN